MSRKLSGKEKFHLNFTTNLQDRFYIWSDVKKSWMTDQEKKQYNAMLIQRKEGKLEEDMQRITKKPKNLTESIDNLGTAIPKTSGYQALERALK